MLTEICRTLDIVFTRFLRASWNCSQFARNQREIAKNHRPGSNEEVPEFGFNWVEW
jgi:hypothetical protein